jgi:Polysaccharide lyase 14
LDATYGFTWAHCFGDQSSQRAVAWHKWAQPVNAPPAKLSGASWRRPYKAGQSLGHDDVYFRMMFSVGTDLREAFNELGMKLPGLAGSYEWSSSGAVTSPPPARDGIWEARLWHSKGSDAHPHLYRGAIYWYGADHPLSRTQGVGLIRYFNLVKFFFQAGRKYCVEQHIKLNTPNKAGGFNSDGVIEVWIDGVPVHRETNVNIRKYPEAQIQDLPFVNVYHGGMGLPKGRYHVSLASFATATKYIGPPTPLSGESRPARPPAQRSVPENK